MKQAHTSPIIFEKFSYIFRMHAHLLIAWAHKDIELLLNTDDEEEITGLLYRSIDNELCSGRLRWFSNYSVKNEAPISNGKLQGKNRKVIDLIIELVAQKGHPKYVFEAKPLNYPKRYQRTPNYIGRDGIERFLKGEYADYTANYPELGMLGYVLSDSPELWRERLKKAIQKKKAVLQLKVPPQNVHLIDALPLEWTSTHERDADRPITIYHILLDCLPGWAPLD